MEIISTKTCHLASYVQGDRSAAMLALVLPGRLDTKDYVHMTSLVDYLANHGYLALSFDPPGTWDSPGGLEIYSTTNYIKAVHELIEHFGNRPTVLLGHSRGGTVTILAGASNLAVTAIVPIAASYGDATPPSAAAMATGTQLEQRDLPPGASRTAEKREFLLPMAYFQDAAQYQSSSFLEACAEPKMLHKLHSEHDYRLHQEALDEVNRVVGEFLDRHA